MSKTKKVAFLVISLLSGFAGPAHADIILEQSGCLPTSVPDFPNFGLGGTVLLRAGACSDPSVKQSSGLITEKTNYSFHDHIVNYSTFDPRTGGGTWTQLISSPAPWTDPEANIKVILDGFVNNSGNPGENIAVKAELTGMFGGITVTASIEETYSKQGNSLFHVEAIGKTTMPGGPHLSMLEVTLTGVGSFHLDRSGTSEITPIPEAPSWGLFFTGLLAFLSCRLGMNLERSVG